MPPVDIDLRTSCTRDEAIAIALGIGLIRFLPPDEDATQEEIEIIESATFCLPEYLHEERDSLESDYVEAKYDQLSNKVISEKRAALDQFVVSIERAQELLREFDDEVAIGELSKIRLLETNKLGIKYYTLNSVSRWVEEITHRTPVPPTYSLSDVDLEVSKPVKQSKLRAQEEAILAEIGNLGHDPKILTKYVSGKHGVKSEVRKSLKENHLFAGSTTFDKAWQKLLDFDDIVYVK
jgi:hypothetical protein